MSSAARAYLAEFLGTFALVLVGTAVATLTGVVPAWENTGNLAISFAFGGVLMVMVWMVGPVSGCHVNPAVSIPMAMSGRLPWSRLPGYLVAQVLGGLLASGLLLVLLSGMEGVGVGTPAYNITEHGLGANGNPTNMTLFSLFMWEVVLTALFVCVIFTTTRPGAEPNFAAPAIGGFLFVAHLIGAQLGDSSLNPARSLAPAVVLACKDITGPISIVWVFLIAPIVGGIIGWHLHQLMYERVVETT